MRNYQLKLSVSFAFLLVMGVVIESQTSKNTNVVEMEGVVERQPASTPTPVATLEKVDPLKSDVYQFDRRMKAIINKSEVLTDVHYTGYLFVDWKEVSKEQRVGIFTFQVKDANWLPVFAEVKISNSYELLSMKVAKTSNENEENALLFLKDLISIYAFKTFEDTSGAYAGNIRIVSTTDHGQVWLKKKVKYSDAALMALKFNQSVHEIHVNAKLEEASGMEETQMGNELKTHGVYLLKKLSVEDSSRLSKAAIVPRSEMLATTLKTNPNQVVQERESWSDLEKKLVKMESLSGKARLSLFHEMVKSLKNSPEALQGFVDWMHSSLNDPKIASMAVGILASVGTPNAQHELVLLYEQSKHTSELTAHLIMNSIATSGAKASPEVVNMLNSALESRRENPELAANAAYALGAAGEIKKITELAGQAESKEEKITYIEAMGNSGSVDTLPFLLESAQSPDPQIREKAIFALRFVNDQKVKAVFEQTMNDASINVRSSVVRAVPFQANPHEYDVLLKTCSTQVSDQNLKKLCSQTLTSI